MGIKLENNTYTVCYSKRHPITRESVQLRRKGIKTQAEARRVLNELVIMVEDKIRSSQVPTWSDTITKFLADQNERGLSGRTIQNYELGLKAHTMKAWGDCLIDQITPNQVRHVVRETVGNTSVSNQQSVVKFIRSAFQYAVESGYLKANPVPKFSLKLTEKIKRVLTEDQARTLLTRAKIEGSEWYYHWAMAIYTGMRSGELYALTWDKVSIETRQIKIDRAWNSKDGMKCTKSGHERIVPINDNLEFVLRELKIAKEDGEYVLPRRAKWEKGEQARELQKFLISVGLPSVRFHDLRATWATILLGKGVEPVRVMKMGGWRDMKTMMIYMRMAGIDTRGATDCLDLHDPTRTTSNVLQLSSL